MPLPFSPANSLIGFVTWVREQTEIYAEIYKRQVFYQHQLSCQVISDCFKSTLDQCSMVKYAQLEKKGGETRAKVMLILLLSPYLLAP